MPGMENFAPERTLTSSGLSARAELLSLQLFQAAKRFVHLAVRSLSRPCAAHVLAAGFGLDREAGRHRESGVGHLGQAGALAAEYVLHLAVTFGRPSPKK